jgi:hypothetical protein
MTEQTKKLQITEMFAFISSDEKDGEGLCAVPSVHGMLPMVGGDMERMDSLRPLAIQLSQMYGMKIKLLKFSVRTELEEINMKPLNKTPS